MSMITTMVHQALHQMPISCKYDAYIKHALAPSARIRLALSACAKRPQSERPSVQISSRFTVALHTLLCIAYFSGSYKLTSGFIASSVGVNPVVIRNILGKLKEAGIVEVEAGVGGASLVRDPSEVTLLDVFDAVESVDGQLFAFHGAPNMSCPVGRRIHPVLDGELVAAQRALEDRLRSRTLADLLDTLNKLSDDEAVEEK